MTHRLGGAALALLVALVSLAFPASATVANTGPPGVSVLVESNYFDSNALTALSGAEVILAVTFEYAEAATARGVLEVTPLWPPSRRLAEGPGRAYG